MWHRWLVASVCYVEKVLIFSILFYMHFAYMPIAPVCYAASIEPKTGFCFQDKFLIHLHAYHLKYAQLQFRYEFEGTAKHNAERKVAPKSIPGFGQQEQQQHRNIRPQTLPRSQNECIACGKMEGVNSNMANNQINIK